MTQLESSMGNQRFFQGEKLLKLTQQQQKQPHHQCIGLLKFQTEDGKSIIGTGFLISPYLVFTVAHNMYLRSTSKYLTKFVFFPGLNGSSSQYEEPEGIRGRACRFPDQYKTVAVIQNKIHDYGIIQLEKAVIRKKYFHIGLNYQLLEKEKLQIYGYNMFSVSTYTEEAFQVGIEKDSSCCTVSDGFLWHKISTQRGNSGSPITIQRNGERIVVAIHQGSEKESNQGKLFTQKVIQNMRKWISQFQEISIYQQGQFIRFQDYFSESRVEEEKMKKNEQIVAQLSKQNKQKQVKIDQLNIKITKLQHEFAQLQKNRATQRIKNNQIIQSKNEQLKTYIQLVNSFQTKEEQYNKKIHQLSSDLQKYNHIINKSKKEELEQSNKKDKNFDMNELVWDLSTPYASKFNILGRRAEPTTSDSYQITSFPLPITGKFQVRLKIQYGSYGNKKYPIWIGLITENRKMSQWSSGGWHEETLSLTTSPSMKKGDIYMSKKLVSSKDQLLIPHGQILELHYDPETRTVTFKNVSNNHSEMTILNSSFFNKKLYIFVKMDTKGDSVTWL